MESGDLMLRSETEGGLLDQMAMLDRRMAEIQNELQQQELRFKHLHDERSLLEQLHTINQMTSRKMNDEVFGEKAFPSKKLFLERLPDPDEFAKVALHTAQRNLEEGVPDADQMLQEVQEKEPMALLHDEIIHVLKSTVKDPSVYLRLDPITGLFLGCAIVTCANTDESERTLKNLTGRWRLPPAIDQPVQIHYVDENTEPRVLVEGLGPDVTGGNLRELLSHYGQVDEFEARDRRDKRGIESASVRFASIDDAYTAISLQHCCPMPPAIYEMEMSASDPQDLVPYIAEALNVHTESVGLISGPEELDTPGRYVLSVSIPDVPPDHVTRLIDFQPSDPSYPRVLGVLPPPAITLRLPKKRKKIRPEDQEQLVILDDKLKLEKEKTSALERELRQVLEPQLRAKRDAAEKANSELEAMRQATGWDERKQFSTHTQMDRENQISELLNELADLQVEQSALKGQNMKKTAMIEALAKKLLRKDDVERDCANLEEQLRQKQEEHRDRVENVRSLKRILNKKGKLTDDLMKHDDTARVKALESDKKVLQHEIARHVDGRRAAEKTIQAQHYRLTQLDNKLKAVASALRELHVKDEPEALYMPPSWKAGDQTVSFQEYNDMQVHLATCRKHLMDKDTQIMDKDQTIEALEKKIDIIARAKAANFKRANIDYKMLQSQYELFLDFKEQQRQEAEAKKDELEEETTGLESRFRRITKSIQESTA
eukprot:TRINITY_DN13174_c0_g1_i1.p1 TRINITY_DN13174_c0_g1~~TRINITY_DN13174_c0_g1_i1.p1  ORF type:complete len:737 (+),score=354.19 TRINITY_DN13174_c0_g1_i1:64-2211(+)